MKKGISVCFLSVLFLLLLNNCNENISPAPTGTDVIMPLAVGNYWIGQSNSYSVTDIFKKPVSSSFDTLKILSDTTINGLQWYKLNEGICLRNTGNSLNTHPYADHPLLFFGTKFPASVGDTFNTEKIYCIVGTCDYGFILDSGYSYYKVVKTDTVISVPKGQFHCYEIRKYSVTTSDPTPKISCPIYYLSVNVGLVKLIRNFSTKFDVIYPTSTWELYDYKLY